MSPQPSQRRYSDTSTFRKIEHLSKTDRPSLLLNEEYDTSGSILTNKDLVEESLDESLESVDSFTSEVPTAARPTKQLIKKASDYDLYELSTKVKVDRSRFKDGVPRSSLSDVKFIETRTILDGEIESNEFGGFFVLFWLSEFFFIVDIVINYVNVHGFESHIVRLMLTDILQIGLTDLWMYLSIYFALFLHLFIAKGYLTWQKSGCYIFTAYEIVFLVFFLTFSERQDFPWIGKIFLLLHQFVLLMKMHSYAYYNGYLWRIYNELEFSKNYFKKHEDLKNDDYVSKVIKESIEFCEFELQSQGKSISFPESINFSNFFWFTMFPTLVYQLQYPRTKKIRWPYVFEKLAAIFGIILVMIVLAQTYMYPFVMKSLALRELPISERIKAFPMIILDIIPIFIIIYMLTFYLIWDAILNCIAELTRFASREFYEDWWNCTSWDAFSRKWNSPVHRFLLRHVYHSTISAFRLSRTGATIFTFLLSSVVHELAMYVLFHNLRFYLFGLQMLQLPLMVINNMKFFKKRKVLGNVFFWFGILTGPSLTCSLYLIF